MIWQRFFRPSLPTTLASLRSPKKGHWLLGLACATVFLLLTSALLVRNQMVKTITPKKVEKPKVVHEPVLRPEYLPAPAVPTNSTGNRYAFATWLSSTEGANSDSLDDDIYFVATRLLVWQVLHDPLTKSSGIDMVVMVGPDVSETHRERLRKDGAIVRPMELVHGLDDAWIVPKFSRWSTVMGKLRAWEMEEYSRVVLLDGDMILQSPLDDIFDDPGVQLMRTKPDVGRLPDEPELPDEYVLGTYMEIGGVRHSWPPKEWEHNPRYFNAGFFVLKPDRKMFEYFLGLLDLNSRFDPTYPEQNLLNYAFRWDGAMPWKEIDDVWNIRFATEKDLDGGVVSIHGKWWHPRSGGNQLRDLMLSKRWQMHGYYMGREGL
ncbi:hypothetical protein S7711_05821 [Stachybotrys chartarum IBT 7711]|uniref:Glycosyltransferase family 8 protein n=1 Tax=Stachybotrys chartarum (strain CBS 109288 / IBT 7711) TaxID=1280523 RepID=A0A084AM59_STACB|nr:hypothetical protein S7711_05821 [Stachybotrys chartarum IBT 7711]KFA56042.1 hypothetical protein S40293_00030 [Stachybotrys chartarum IBT 40293]